MTKNKMSLVAGKCMSKWNGNDVLVPAAGSGVFKIDKLFVSHCNLSNTW